MKHLKHKRAVLAVLAFLSLAGCFQILGAYERGYIGSFLPALLLSLVCLFLFCMFAFWAQAVDKLVEKKKLPGGRQPRQRAQENYHTFMIHKTKGGVKP